MSRPRLEEIIKKYDLYPKVRKAGSMFDAVETMREQIIVKVNESRGSRDAAPASFEVTFEGDEPSTVRDVTAAIANLFVEDNLRFREEQAVSTSKFLERELKRIREELRQKEEEVRQFKEEYMGMLPEQMENNYRILAQLQQQLDSLNVTLQQTEDRRVLLQSQLAGLETLKADLTRSGKERPLSLDDLRQQLQNLRSRYSERHPDVIRLEATIARMEEQESNSLQGNDLQESSIPTSPSEAQRLMVVQKESLLTQLKMIDSEAQKLNQEIGQTSKQIETYRRRIENGPKIEQVFLDLRRDYEEASENYQSLLEKKMQAQLAENLERTQKGEQFKVLEPANLPQTPYKPNIPKVLMLGLMLALSGGGGLAFLREHLDQTYWSSKDLKGVLEIPVLVSIPPITTDNQQRWNLFRKATTVCVLLVMCSAIFYALLVLWRQNPLLLPL
jgi:polysaccharide chain length determinant protein (PEP-CTERM system associated)